MKEIYESWLKRTKHISCDYIKTNKMDRKDLLKKILELSLELKDAEGVQAMMCITDMENAVKDYEKQLRLYNVSQQRELLRSYNKFVNEKCLLADGTLSNFEIEKFEERNCG